MKVMSSVNVSKYKDLLEKKRDELLAGAPARTPASEPGSKSGDWIDQSSQESDLHVRLALKQTDAKLLRAIEEAIHRIEHGAYGICMECEEEIAAARLEAVPWTRVCIDCKVRQQG
jgi:DnaK suppressor protein